MTEQLFLGGIYF